MDIPQSASGRIVILGASCRAAAASAAAAGLEVYAADLFGDLDLRAASFRVVESYPADLAAAAAAFPPAPWLFTGALENHPDLIAAISHERFLAGCRPEAIRQVRDPDQLASSVRRIGLAFPDTRRDPDGLPADGSWLVKPLRSAGGHGIRPWRGAAEAARHGGLPDGPIWQQRLTGQSWSVAYLLTPGGGRLLGLTRQFIGRRWCGAGPFAYSGSITAAPHPDSSPQVRQLRRLGDLLAGTFGLRGLVGVDLLRDRWNQLHVLEVNPRPTASMELFERAIGGSLIAAHLAACGMPQPSRPRDRDPRPGSWAKAILFSDRPLSIDEAVVTGLQAAAACPPDGWPRLADIPRPPSAISAGRPVCTLFAHGETPQAAWRRLRQRVAAVASALRRAAQPASRRCAGSGSATYCIR
ncbi:MAG: ATP-grasp domain-containing protein [Planctomycetota bacterium]|jgi:predicted ATP-grasp superfamily ATP-dependent carboligase|nr:ATP-grasp domain-containing protein [Planctomycetota bacterium]MDA1201313.1 ATP-grasp domain-containing protein [Planctomycetota bacterium]